MTTKIRWHEQSGIRERLALLASRGPHNLTEWDYNPRTDRWIRAGHMAGPYVEVKQEGSRSLELIEQKYKLNRREAMALIGYPEAK